MERIQTLLSKFRDAAIQKGDGVSPVEQDHLLHLQMKEALDGLRSAGELGKAAFRRLLEDESDHVRVWVAAELLSRGDGAARVVLEKLATQPGPLGFSAPMTLKEHAAGELRSPF